MAEKLKVEVGDTVKIAGERSNINGRLNAAGEVQSVSGDGKTAVVHAGIYMRGPAELHVNTSRLTVIQKAEQEVESAPAPRSSSPGLG